MGDTQVYTTLDSALAPSVAFAAMSMPAKAWTREEPHRLPDDGNERREIRVIRRGDDDVMARESLVWRAAAEPLVLNVTALFG
jgi:hypothetical protein